MIFYFCFIDQEFGTNHSNNGSMEFSNSNLTENELILTISTVIFTIVSLFIISTNGFVAVFLCRIKDNKFRDRASMILSLCYCDIIVGVGGLFLSISKVFNIFDRLVCVITSIFLDVGTISSIYQILFICIERFLAVKSKTTQKKIFGNRVRHAISFSALLFFFTISAFAKKMLVVDDFESCTFSDLYGDNFYMIVRVYVFALYLPPFTISIFLYSCILYKLRKIGTTIDVQEGEKGPLPTHIEQRKVSGEVIAVQQSREKSTLPTHTEQRKISHEAISVQNGGPFQAKTKQDDVVLVREENRPNSVNRKTNLGSVVFVKEDGPSTANRNQRTHDGFDAFAQESTQSLATMKQTKTVCDKATITEGDQHLGNKKETKIAGTCSVVQQDADQLKRNTKATNTNDVFVKGSPSAIKTNIGDITAVRRSGALDLSTEETKASRFLHPQYKRNYTRFFYLDTEKYQVKTKSNHNRRKSENQLSTFELLSRQVKSDDNMIQNRHKTSLEINSRLYIKRTVTPMKATKTVGIIILTMVLTSGIAQVLYSIEGLCKDCKVTVGQRLLVTALWFLNSVLNPIICILGIDELKSYFVNIFRRKTSQVIVI